MMKEYTVKFEMFGKKMKTTVYAASEEDAKQKIRDRVVFYSVEQVYDKNVEYLMNIFGMKK